MTMLRLTNGRGRRVWVRAESVFALEEGEDRTAVIALTGHIVSVTETPAEILALLAEPAPSVEVTEAVAQAATDAYDEEAKTWSWGDRSPMIAAIIAADRARGLRP